MKQLISVIIPVYNTESYIKRAINSLLKQTYDNIEIICVDDGSTDNSLQILEKYAEQYDNIKVIHTENGGISHARNIALDCCNGDYIAFLDSDDYYHEQMLEILYKAMQENECDMSVCNIVNFDDDGIDKLILDLPEQYDITVHSGSELMNYYYSLEKDKVQKAVMVSIRLYNRKIWENIRFPVGRIYEDNAVMHLIAQQINSFADVSLGLYYRYLRNDSIMGQSKAFSIKNFDILYNQKERCDFFEKENIVCYLRQAYKEYLHTLRVMYKGAKKNELDDKTICPKLKHEYKLYFSKAKRRKVYSVYDIFKETIAGLLMR